MFDKLKSLFVEEDKRSKGKKKAAAKETTKTTAPQNDELVPSTQPIPSSGPVSTSGKANDKFMNILFGAMDKANLPGFDYLEYKQSLKNLAKMPMDEQTRYQSAFAMAKTMGATPQNLLDAAQHYINILKEEEKKFQMALVNQRSRQVGDKEKAIQQTTALVEQKKKQIEQLKKEIEKDHAKLEKMKSEISGATNKVEKTKNDFVASFNTIIAQIVTDMDKMKQYLK